MPQTDDLLEVSFEALAKHKTRLDDTEVAISNIKQVISDTNENIRELDERTGAGWKDLTSSFHVMGIPPENLPAITPFGSSGLRREFAFDIGDYIYAQPFHINHDVKIGGKCYAHIHWSTSGADTNTVKWEFQISRALGYDQEYFSAETSYFVEQAPNGAWRHMVAELSDADALTLTEPDELLLVTVRRVTNGGVDNIDNVFGLTVDLHYEANRDSTPNRAPDFYSV